MHLLLNAKKSDNTTVFWNGVYGNPSSYLRSSNLNNLLKLTLANVEDCEFVDLYNGNTIYYKTEDINETTFVDGSLCNIKSLPYQSEIDGPEDRTITTATAVKPLDFGN